MIKISKQANSRQSGVVLLVLLLVLAFSFTAYYFSSISIIEIKADKIQKTRLELKRAKQALIAYALTHWRTPEGAGRIGKLPCPDHNDATLDGVKGLNCEVDYKNGFGYLPWRTLGLGITEDSSGSCLIYAVSPGYKAGSDAALNREGYGQLKTVDSNGDSLQGPEPEDRLVAIIIAPENELSGQARLHEPEVKCGSYYSYEIEDLAAAFLDDDGTTNNTDIATSEENVIDAFVSKYNESEALGSVLNDRLITISYSEIWTPLLEALDKDAYFVTKMHTLTKALAMCLAEYAQDNDDNPLVEKKSLPWPAALDVNENEYRNSYSYDDNVDDTKGHAGRLPYQVRNSNGTIGNNLTEAKAPYKGFMEYDFCADLDVDGTGMNNINLNDPAGEYWNLWFNWKEYFFYALSKSNSPDNTVENCDDGCVEIEGEKRAGIVFFSGFAGVGQQRYGPPLDGAKAVDGNDKDEIINYLQNNNAINFPDDLDGLPADDGEGNFNATGASSNDIMYCINQDLTVNACI